MNRKGVLIAAQPLSTGKRNYGTPQVTPPLICFPIQKAIKSITFSMKQVLERNPRNRLLTYGKKSVCGLGFSLILNLNAWDRIGSRSRAEFSDCQCLYILEKNGTLGRSSTVTKECYQKHRWRFTWPPKTPLPLWVSYTFVIKCSKRIQNFRLESLCSSWLTFFTTVKLIFCYFFYAPNNCYYYLLK